MVTGSEAALEDPAIQAGICRLYREFFDRAERKRRWSLRDDIPWSQSNRAMDPAGAFSDDSRLLATAGLDGRATILDAVECRRLATLAPHTGRVRSVSFSPDGSRLATAGGSGEVNFWDTQMFQEVGRVPGSGHSADTAAYSPSGCDAHALRARLSRLRQRLKQLDPVFQSRERW